MKKFETLTEMDLKNVIGGSKSGGKYHYYGNGVSCNRYHCRTDWGKAWYCIVNRMGAAYATGGKATIGRC